MSDWTPVFAQGASTDIAHTTTRAKYAELILASDIRLVFIDVQVGFTASGGTGAITMTLPIDMDYSTSVGVSPVRCLYADIGATPENILGQMHGSGSTAYFIDDLATDRGVEIGSSPSFSVASPDNLYAKGWYVAVPLT